MKKVDPSIPVKPSVQVLERMFTLIDVLASREEAISLKEISEKTGLSLSAVKSHIQNGKRNLKISIQRKEERRHKHE